MISSTSNNTAVNGANVRTNAPPDYGTGASFGASWSTAYRYVDFDDVSPPLPTPKFEPDPPIVPKRISPRRLPKFSHTGVRQFQNNISVISRR